MNIPDGMPTLSRGGHVKGGGLACVMEYVSIISGDRWTDRPVCTDTAVAELAIFVNDSIADDDTRSRLMVPLIPRLLAATPQEGTLDLVRTVIQDVTGVNLTPGGCLCGCSSTENATIADCMDNVFNDDANAWRNRSSSDKVKVLVAVLDAYDEVYKPTPVVVTEERLAEAQQRVLNLV